MRMCSRIGRSPIGTSGLGRIVVYGRSRIPRPPARITALIVGPQATSGRPWTVAPVLSMDMAEQLVDREPARGARQTANVRKIVIVPALNEERSIGSVIAEIRAADLELNVVVIDDGSTDRTAIVAAQHGAQVLGLPFNLG